MPEVLTLSRSLYLPEAVQAAASAFAELATIEVRVLDSDIEVSLDAIDPDVDDVLADELMNHALHETILQHRMRREAR